MPLSRALRRWLLLSGILLLFLCLGGLAYLITSYPILRSTAVSAPPITWTSLPIPRVIQPNFTSYSHAAPLNDLARRDGLLWAASNGGLLVWDERTGEVAKFTSEHGLAENRTTSVAIGLDGSIWVGTASAGVGRYDGAAWQTFTSADGLPGNSVRDLAISADGTVWAATADGIGRYDGRRWFSYNRRRTLLPLPGSNVTSLALAPDGVTIFAGTSEGVLRFNGRSWNSLAQVGSEAINTVQDVAVTPDGRLWAATQAGLTVYDGSGWQIFTSADGLASDDIRRVAANTDGSVWAGYGDQGLGLTRFELSSGIPVAAAVTPPNEQISAILPAANSLWLGSSDGLLRQDSSGSWQSFTPPNDIPANDLIDLVLADGQPWLATATGVSRLDGTSWEMVAGLPETAVSNLALDNSGQPWVTFASVGQGAAFYDATSASWQTVSCPVSGPASPYVRHIVQTDDGRLWLATEAGLATFNPDTQRWNLFTREDGLPGDAVQALARHPDGTLWVGTNEGLAVGADGRFTTLNEDDIRELAIGPDGTAWFITEDTVYRWRNGQSESLLAPPVSQVFDVLATADGFWLAAAEGVAFFNGGQAANGRWLRFGRNDGLPGSRTTALGVAADGTVWASSDLLPNEPPLSSGLYGSYTIGHHYVSFFDGQAWRPAILPLANGPLHPVITSITTTPDGAAWLASLGGISRFDGQRWDHFTVLDGLPGYEVYQFLAVETAVWAVTKGGLAQFNPATQQWKSFAGVGDWTDFAAVRLAADASGMLWAGSGTELRRYDGQTWQLVPIDLPDPAVTVQDFVVEPDGRLWLTAHLETPTTSQHFLAEFADQQWRWHEVELPDSFEPFSWLWLGPDGRLWASNNASLWRFNLPGGSVTQPGQYPELIRAITDLAFLPNGKPVATTRLDATPLLLEPDGAVPLEQPLAASDAFAIHTDENGRLWLGTNEGAARQLDDGTWQAFPLSEQTAAETVTELAVEPDGRLLLGTSGGSVLRWAAGQITLLDSTPGSAAGSPISALFTAADGTLWQGSFGGSVARLNADRWLPFPASPSIYNERVREAAVSDPGTLWLATADSLVSVTTVGQRTVCQRVAVDYPGIAGLAADLADQLWLVSERIVYLGNAAGFERMGTLALPVTAVAPDGAVWYVTQTELVRVQGSQRLPVAHNLDHNTITALAIAPDGTVWLGTTAGAAVFSGGQWQTITAADGLASNHVTHIAIAADGSVWVGTEGGVSWIRP
ncbi:MAG: hypothetical protein IPM53_07655 [Anaerolineaceae bacterium]|nr:hypothetical protein [Anaerolineaceae bacterium]